MNLFRRNEHRGITSSALRLWGLFFALAGAVSYGILQNRVLGLSGASAQEVLARMQESSTYMTIASVALVLQAAETCAVPIFALMVVEGALHTKSLPKYLLRVLLAALAAEIPFDLLFGTGFLDFSVQNPSFALALGLVMLRLYLFFPVKSWSHRFVRLFVTLAAILWAEMLQIHHGTPLILLTAVFWLLREIPRYRGLVSAGVALCCTFISPFYLAAPFGAMAAHVYNGKQGSENRIVNYALYPALLLITWALAVFFLGA